MSKRPAKPWLAALRLDKAAGLTPPIPTFTAADFGDRAARRKELAERRAAPEPKADGSVVDPTKGPVIICDTREQEKHNSVYDFSDLGIATVRAKLDVGDYALLGAEGRMSLERKTIADAHSSLIGGRSRFEAELERSKALEFFAILIEGTAAELAAYEHPLAAEKLTDAQRAARPAQVLGTLLSWELRYGVHVIFGASRDRCRRRVVRYCESFHRMIQEEREAGPRP